MKLLVSHLIALAIAVLSPVYAFAEIVIASDYGDRFNKLNESNGTVTAIPETAAFTPFFSSSDFGSSNQLYGLQGFTLYRIDFDFGANTYSSHELRDLASGSDAITLSSNGDLYVYNGSGSTGEIGRVDLNTGAETLIPLSKVNGSRVFLQGIDFSPTGQLYGVDGRMLYKIDPVTGLVTQITPTGGNSSLLSIFTELDYSASGILRAITFGQTVWQIDPNTGLAFDGITYKDTTFSSLASTAIPEPTSCCLLAGGALAMFWRRKRRSADRK